MSWNAIIAEAKLLGKLDRRDSKREGNIDRLPGAAEVLRKFNERQAEFGRGDHPEKVYRQANMLLRIRLRLEHMRSARKRIVSCALLVIPSKRRKEIVGDFMESIQSAREQGVGRFGRWMLIAAKLLLYSWCVLKLRFGDLIQPSEDTEAAEH